MSKYLTFTDVVFTDQKLLLAALKECGFATIEVGEKLNVVQHWSGYGPAPTTEAQIVIRRAHSVPGAFNDLGFAFDPERKGYVPLVDHYDQNKGIGGKPLLVALRTAYSRQVIATVASRLHGSQQVTKDNGVIKIKVRF